MQSITSLVTRLAEDFPAFRFKASDEFHWSPDNSTIYFDPSSGDTASLLHELSHAQLSHHRYTRDIQLIEMERDAWNHAKTMLSQKYDIIIDDDLIEDSMDTYRDWLHARSRCPECSATGIQVKKYEYKCIGCGVHWKVNDARICSLRRYTIK